MTENLSELELEVEHARAKLANDLEVLTSPRTYEEFADGMKSRARSMAERVLDDVKARAAANPSAALAIGAGIAWQLIRHPPIATALIGAGVISLWRTTPELVDVDDYVGKAQQRFTEQVGEAASTVKHYADDAMTAARAITSEYASAAQDKIQDLVERASDKLAEGIGQAGDAARHLPEHAVETAQRATSRVRRAVNDDGIRDQLLLGAAGLAVLTALGLAYQGRSNSEGERTTRT